MSTDTDWTDKKKTQLRALWNLGLSILEIGNRMGISKHAVRGKAYRMGLARRKIVCPAPRNPRGYVMKQPDRVAKNDTIYWRSHRGDQVFSVRWLFGLKHWMQRGIDSRTLWPAICHAANDENDARVAFMNYAMQSVPWLVLGKEEQIWDAIMKLPYSPL